MNEIDDFNVLNNIDERRSVENIGCCLVKLLFLYKLYYKSRIKE